jgi:hypothetical protein
MWHHDYISSFVGGGEMEMRPLERPWHKWQENIKMDIMETRV